MIQEPQPWQPELATREGLGADPPDAIPWNLQGTRGAAGGWESSAEGWGQLGVLGCWGLLWGCLGGLVLVGILGKELSGR